jgi:hypothetical protein
MKNLKLKIKSHGTLLLLYFAFSILRCAAQTPVLFPLAQMTGTTNDTTITVRPVINPIKFHSQIYWLPTAGIQLATKNGSATTNLIPNDYNVTIAGVPGSWKISVSDTNVILNAAEIGNLTVYSASGPLPGVTQITAGNNITISPTDGMGVVTVNSTGGGAATNGYQSQAGNHLITISTNLTDLIYTFSGVSQTNGYPWGVLYDAAGAAQAATNGISISSGLAAFRRTNTFDAAGSASAATNGYPWGSLYDAAGSATAATNGFPWGVLYDAAGTAQAATNGLSLASGLAAFRATNTFDQAGAATNATNGLSLASGLSAFRSTNSFDVAGSAGAATNGYPWGTLYDAAGSATAATNGWPWGILYDPAGAAASVTNGFPWGVLYDAAGTAQAATNGLSLASGLAAFRATNTFDQAGAATSATNGLSLASGLAAFRSTNSFDVAGSASAATNGYPWGTLYDAAGSATAATNGWPWGALYDPAGAATAATNGLSLASGLAAFRGTNTFAPTNAATASALGLVKVDNSTITVSADGTITATTGGGGSVTSVALSVPGEFSVSGSPLTTSGTLAITRTADANFLGFGATNIGFIKITNTAAISGSATISVLTVTNGFTNQSLTASTLLQANANKRVSSIANGIGALTNDASGNFGYAPLLDASALKATQYVAADANTNLVSTQNGFSWTNMDTHFTNYGTTTNITLPADGNSWRVLATNGPHLFFNFGGNNMGAISIWITTNGDTQWPAQLQMLGYSNHLTTNCIIDFQPFGGTNKVLGGESEL